MSAAEVARVVRCAPPKICQRVKHWPVPGDRARIVALVDAAAIAERVLVAIPRALVAGESGFRPGAVNAAAKAEALRRA
jgi:hypothetical protein